MTIEYYGLQIAASDPAGTAAGTVTVAAAKAQSRIMVTYCHVAKATLTVSIVASFGGTHTIAAEIAAKPWTYAAGVNPGFNQVQAPIIGPVTTDLRVVLATAAAEVGYYLIMWQYVPG